MRVKQREAIRTILQLLVVAVVIFIVFVGVPRRAMVHNICPYTSIQVPLIRLGWYFIPGIIIGVLFALSSFVYPRIFCGWVCPIGTLQRWLVYPARWLRLELKPALRLNRSLVLIPFAILIWVSAGTFTTQRLYELSGCPLWWLCNIGVAAAGIFTIAFLFLSLIGSLFVERFFCRYLCPYGAFLGLLSKLARYRITVDTGNCASCSLCRSACPMGLHPDEKEREKSHLCISCGRCIDACPKKALRFKP